MALQQYPALSERLYRETLANGLTVMVSPRPGFAEKVAYLVTDYGSIHTEFFRDGTPYRTPAGIAHYLEHKMFDLPGRDVSAEFAALGANVNAFTSYDMTAYYFSCTEKFSECLKLLLEFVSTPYFTQQTVEKEREIIGQEIDMSADSPDIRVFENLTRAMYFHHPIREPILGTRHSIAQITPQTLFDCHRAFYRPDNMLLCVVGDVSPEEVAELAGSIPAAVPRIQKAPFSEPMRCREARITASMDVAMPMFQLGFKAEPPGKGAEAVRQELIGDLAAEALFGEASALYLKLYETGVIDSSFGGGFETVDGVALLTASGDSDDPERVFDAVLRQAAVLADTGIPDFDRSVRSALGRRIRGLDSLDATCYRLCAYALSGFDYYDFPQVYRTVGETDIQEFLRRVVSPERGSLSVITPLSQEVST